MAGDTRYSTTFPDELVQYVAEQRVIPFVGAGFSAGLSFPTWDTLLSKVADEIDLDISYSQIREFANRDPLQIAEYLFLKSHRSMGTLRYIINKNLPGDKDPLSSGPHVELVNLGAAQIYTTNYDDLIEGTFKALHVPANTIRVARDVATARSDCTQIVKYHGDLRHDETLVLTETSYYSRLDFETPMDVKFRSDLLGRSVLFMGYSFRDINIRVIWFKLMKMMRDIPEDDRRPSYMVRLEPNPVAMELDRGVGLRTIVLDEEGSAKTPEQKSALLGSFLHRLSVAASEQAIIPGSSDTRMFISPYLINALSSDLTEYEGRRRTPPGLTPFSALPRAFPRAQTSSLLSNRRVREFTRRRVPDGLFTQCHELYLRLIPSQLGLGLPDAVRLAAVYGPSSQLTELVAQTYLRESGRNFMRPLEPRLDWSLIWGAKLPSDSVKALSDVFYQEFEIHRNSPDDDLAYFVDVFKRIEASQIFEITNEYDAELVGRVRELLFEAGKLYSSVDPYTPDPVGPPRVESIVEEIEQNTPSDTAPSDQGPF